MKEKQLLQLFKDIHEIKHKERQGWKEIGVERPRDTIASHSFGAALLGWTLAEKEGFDTEKTIKALLVHDLIMAYVPDYTPEDEEFDSKKKEERKKTEQLLEDMPEEIRPEVEEILEELGGQETGFARFVKECDKLETLFQVLIYSEDLGENQMEQFMETYEDYFETETGREIFEMLEERSNTLSR